MLQTITPRSIFKSMMANGRHLEGVLAVNKPPGISSAQVLRDLQGHFTPSEFFGPWIQAEGARRKKENRTQRRRRRDKEAVKVKIGHGGTLDPLATGVLVAGLGKGTKLLQQFLTCTKTYEAVVLFGAATDTYDRLGKIVGRAPYEHVTREKVEEALGELRGAQMQRPPVFSAIRINGKHLYEYARNGEELPKEIEERPVTVHELELVEWFDGGQHDHTWPSRQADAAAKIVAEKLFDARNESTESGAQAKPSASPVSPAKRKRPSRDDEVESDDSDREIVFKVRSSHKRRNKGPEPMMSGGLGPRSSQTVRQPLEPTGTATLSGGEAATTSGDPAEESPQDASASEDVQPPAAKLRLTVTSGFYVRSLCHDLGRAVGSLGIMCELVRTRQGQFRLASHHESLQETLDGNKNNDNGPTTNIQETQGNVIEYEDLAKGEAVWGPKVERLLAMWNNANGDADSRVGSVPLATTATADTTGSPSAEPAAAEAAGDMAVEETAGPSTDDPKNAVVKADRGTEHDEAPAAKTNLSAEDQAEGTPVDVKRDSGQHA